MKKITVELVFDFENGGGFWEVKVIDMNTSEVKTLKRAVKGNDTWQKVGNKIAKEEMKKEYEIYNIEEATQ
jgi:hypothetical protein